MDVYACIFRSRFRTVFLFDLASGVPEKYTKCMLAAQCLTFSMAYLEAYDGIMICQLCNTWMRHSVSAALKTIRWKKMFRQQFDVRGEAEIWKKTHFNRMDIWLNGVYNVTAWQHHHPHFHFPLPRYQGGWRKPCWKVKHSLATLAFFSKHQHVQIQMWALADGLSWGNSVHTWFLNSLCDTWAVETIESMSKESVNVDYSGRVSNTNRNQRIQTGISKRTRRWSGKMVHTDIPSLMTVLNPAQHLVQKHL